jgi:hypothetical protein
MNSLPINLKCITHGSTGIKNATYFQLLTFGGITFSIQR